MKNLFAIAMALGCAVGCGGGGDDTLLRDVEGAEAEDLCNYFNDQLPSAPVECTVQGQMVTIDPAEVEIDCSTAATEMNDVPETCDATVGDYEDCADAFGDDLCSVAEGDLPAACAFLESADCAGEESRAVITRMVAARNAGRI